MVDVVLKQLDDQVRARGSRSTRLVRDSTRPSVASLARFSDIRAFPLPSPTVPQSGDVSSLAIKCLPPLVKGASERAAGEVIDALCAKLVAAGKDHRAHRDAGVIGLKSVVADLGAHPAAPRVISALVPKLVAHVRAAVDSGDAAKNTGAAGDVSGDCLDVLHAAVSSESAALAAVADDRIVSPPLLAYLAESGRHGARKRAVACLAALAANVSDATLASVADAASSKLARSPTPARVKPPPLATTRLCTPTSSARPRNPRGDDSDGTRTRRCRPCWRCARRRRRKAARRSRGVSSRDGTLRRGRARTTRGYRDDSRMPSTSRFVCVRSIQTTTTTTTRRRRATRTAGRRWTRRTTTGTATTTKGTATSTTIRVGKFVAAPRAPRRRRRRVPRDARGAVRTDGGETPRATRRTRRERQTRRLRRARGDVSRDVARARRRRFARRRRESRRAARHQRGGATIPRTRRHPKDKDGGVQSPPRDRRESSRRVRVRRRRRRRAGRRRRRRRRRVGRIRIRIRIHERSFDRRVRVDGRGRGDVRVEALVFARLAFASHPPSACASFAKTLAPAMCSATSDRYYKVAAEALRACEAATGAVHEVASATKDASIASRLFDAALERVAAADQDQEVKEAAISCAAAAAATLGDVLSPDAISRAATALLERTRNDATRVAATKALGDVARSRVGVNLSDVVTDGARAFASFLRKNDRTLRHASLDTLCALFAGENARHVADDVAGVAVAEAARLVSDADVALASVADADVARRFEAPSRSRPPSPRRATRRFPRRSRSREARSRAGARPRRFDSFSPRWSPLGARTGEETRAALMDAAIASADAGTTDAGSALASSSATAKVLGECVAAVCAEEDTAGENVSTRVAETLASDARGRTRARDCRVSRVGRTRTRRGARVRRLHGDGVGGVRSRGVRRRGRRGSIRGGVRARRRGGGVVARAISTRRRRRRRRRRRKRRYAFLLAAREMIEAVGVGAGVGGGASDAGDADDARASERNVSAFSAEEAKTVADALCPARLTRRRRRETSSPSVSADSPRDIPRGGLVARLAELADPTVDAGKDPNARITAVTAGKYLATTLARGDDASAAEASAALASFAGEQSLRDADRGVRRAAAQTLSAAAHARPASVLPILPDVLPILLESAAVDESLVRVVDLGPFKVTVDDGLDARRAAFECVDTLLDGCLRPDAPGNPLERLDVAPGIVAALVGGVGDHYDVKMIAHSALAKLSKSRAGAAAVLDAGRSAPRAHAKDAHRKTQIGRRQTGDRQERRSRAELSARGGGVGDDGRGRRHASRLRRVRGNAPSRRERRRPRSRRRWRRRRGTREKNGRRDEVMRRSDEMTRSGRWSGRWSGRAASRRDGGEVDTEMYVHPRLFFTRLDRRHTRETASLFL